MTMNAYIEVTERTVAGETSRTIVNIFNAVAIKNRGDEGAAIVLGHGLVVLTEESYDQIKGAMYRALGHRPVAVRTREGVE